MEQYLDLLQHILDKGQKQKDRTGTGTLSIFGYQMRFDLQEGFPLLTTKKIHFKSVVHELLWFLRGDTDNRSLQAKGVRIWNEWATKEQTACFGRKEGDLGPIYGHQWRRFGASLGPEGAYKQDGVDQIARVVQAIQTSPHSRRLIVTGWNPKEADLVALPPCHTLFQFYVHNNELSCQLYQRSADVFLGVPFNIASYALLTMMVAKVCNLRLGEFVHTFGDAHLYLNHREQAQKQLARAPRSLPVLHINRCPEHVWDFAYDDFKLVGYKPHPHIKAEVSV